MLAVATVAQAQSGFDLPQTQTFDDPQSALNDRSNLQSRQFQDFIQTLYRNDADSLNRANHLFESADTSATSVPNDANNAGGQRQPTYADYVRQQQQQQFASYNGNDGIRSEREANVVRPLFVYRVFQEMENKRTQDRAIRRLYKYRKSHNKNHHVRSSSHPVHKSTDVQ